MNPAITVAWWNTGLARERTSSADFGAAARVLSVLAETHDLLALGEVPPDAEATLLERATLVQRFSPCIDIPLTRRRVSLLARSGLTARFCNNIETVAHVAATRFEVSLATLPAIQLLVSHWPAEGPGDQTARRADRLHLGVSLRCAVAAIGTTAPVVLLGDYNLDPYDDALTDALLATPDRDVVRGTNRDASLYNLAWRWLAAEPPFEPHMNAGRRAGTLRYRDGRYRTWRTVDQVIVAPALLTSTAWTLDEARSGVWHHDVLRGPKGAALGGSFDHLPVSLRLEYIAPEATR